MSNSDFYIQNMIETSLEQEDFSQIIIVFRLVRDVVANH